MSTSSIPEQDNCLRVATTDELRAIGSKAVANNFAAYLEADQFDILVPDGKHVGHIHGVNDDGTYRVMWLAQTTQSDAPATGLIDVLPSDFNSLAKCEDESVLTPISALVLAMAEAGV